MGTVKKKGKKKIILLSVVGVLVLLIVVNAVAGANRVVPIGVDTSALEKTTLRNVVSTTGAVKSADSVSVYAKTSAYPVDTVAVKVGDYVEAGQTLVQLKTADLEKSISQKKQALETSQQSANLQLQMSQKKYNDQKSNLDSGLNTQMNSAKIQLESAQEAYNKAQEQLTPETSSQLSSLQNAMDTANRTYQRAQRDYNDAKQQSSDEYRYIVQQYEAARSKYNICKNAWNDLNRKLGNDPNNEALKKQVEDAKTALDDAEANMNQASRDLNDFENDYTNADGSSLKRLRQSYEDSLASYNNAKASYDMAVTSANGDLPSLQRKVEDAQIAYDAAKTAVDQSLSDAKLSLESSRLSSDLTTQKNDLKNMEDSLADCIVTAPASGTVTAVSAKAGGAATGVLVTIENTGALEISVKVKEYDIAAVKVGMPCIIRVDALEGQEFQGILKEIAPAADKVEMGSTTSSVEFSATVQVTSANTPLRIGMNAKADIVLDEKKDVYAVSFDAVVTGSDGQSIVFVTAPSDKGYEVAKSIPVTQGMEGDYQVEVSGELSDGMMVIESATGLKDGDPILPGGAVGSTGFQGMMGMAMG